MKDIRVKVNPNPNIKSRLGAENIINVVPTFGFAGGELRQLGDVDLSNLGDGYVLIYDANVKKWVSTNILTPGETQNLTINGGNF